MQAMPVQSMRGKSELQISDAIEREGARLWRFIRSRIPDRSDAEDLLQDVFREYVQARRRRTGH